MRNACTRHQKLDFDLKGFLELGWAPSRGVAELLSNLPGLRPYLLAALAGQNLGQEESSRLRALDFMGWAPEERLAFALILLDHGVPLSPDWRSRLLPELFRTPMPENERKRLGVSLHVHHQAEAAQEVDLPGHLLAEPEPEFEEVETEVQPIAPQIHIPAIPTSPPAVAPQEISAPAPTPVPVQIPVSLGPTWEPDEPFNPIVLQTLTEAERMIVEASSVREVSPSDDELQARLEVGRSRLSQIYNGMRRKGLLSVRKQGRTRYFKLSEAAGQHLRGAPQGVV